MKSLKSVAVAVVLGSLLCSGGLGVAQSSPSFNVTLNNQTDASDLALVLRGQKINSTGKTPVCAVNTTCKYSLTSVGSYTVEGIFSGGVLDSLIHHSVTVSESGEIYCVSMAEIGALYCQFTAGSN